MRTLTPDPALVARFRADFEAITRRSPDNDVRLGIAVSGGADSLALLLLAAAAWPGAVVAATVDHGTRPETMREAAFVGELCARIAVPHAVLAASESPPTEGNLQDWARSMRYALLADWARGHGVAWVATAHQQDDVAESFLMRARRGSGVGGLAAMPLCRAIGSNPGAALLVRPLAGWARIALAGIVAAAGIEPVEDPSNTDPRFDRSRIRALLAENPELSADRLALAAVNLRHAEDALGWLADREWAARSEVEPDGIRIDPSGLPYEVRRRLAQRAVEALAPAWRGAGIDALTGMLDSGQSGTIAEVQARAISGRWHFRLAPPRRSH